jgi:small subunit ribosomal protein S3
MGQKINPISLRIGNVKTWAARWFFPAKGRAVSVGKYPYARFLEEDEAIRKAIRKKIGQAGIAGIEIERTSNNIRILIKAARPGLVIGQGGKSIEELTRTLENAIKKIRLAKINDKQPINMSVNVEELKRSEVSAAYVAQQIAWDLEKRMPFRWTMKKYLGQISQNKEAKGVKITLSGRLNGAEIARHETMKQGSLPLQTLRADIDYGQVTAFTTYGTVGVKVWIYKGQIFGEKTKIHE